MDDGHRKLCAVCSLVARIALPSKAYIVEVHLLVKAGAKIIEDENIYY